MGHRKQSRWKQILGKMALNLGRLYRNLYGPAVGGVIYDEPEAMQSHRHRRRQQRHRKGRQG